MVKKLIILKKLMIFSCCGGSARQKKAMAALLFTVLPIGQTLSGCSAVPGQETVSEEHKQKEEYEKLTAQAGDELSLEDYKKAVLSAGKARELDENQPEAYEILYECRVAQDKNEAAEQVTAQAKSALSKADFSSYQEQAERIRHDYQLVNSYTVIQDLGTIQMAPMSLDDQVWLIRQNDEYSILNTEGEIEEGYTDPFSILIIGHDQVESGASLGSQIVRACMSPEHAMIMNETRQWPVPTTPDGNWCTVSGIIGPQPEYELDENHQVVLTEESKKGYEVFHAKPEELIRPIYLREAGKSDGDFYIYNPAKDQLLGPYLENEKPGFSLLTRDFRPSEEDASEDMVYLINWWQYLLSPFWSQDSENQDLYTIWSADGTSSLDGFEKAEVVDSKTIAGRKDGLLTVYGLDLTEEYRGDFDAGSAAFDNRALVLKDGSWKLVEFGEQVRLKDVKSK